MSHPNVADIHLKKFSRYFLRGRVMIKQIDIQLTDWWTEFGVTSSLCKWKVGYGADTNHITSKNKWRLTFSHCMVRGRWRMYRTNKQLKLNAAVMSSRQSSFIWEKKVRDTRPRRPAVSLRRTRISQVDRSSVLLPVCFRRWTTAAAFPPPALPPLPPPPLSSLREEQRSRTSAQHVQNKNPLWWPAAT